MLIKHLLQIVLPQLVEGSLYSRLRSEIALACPVQALMLAAAVDSVDALQVLMKNGTTVELQVRHLVMLLVAADSPRCRYFLLGQFPYLKSIRGRIFKTYSAQLKVPMQALITIKKQLGG